MTADAPALAGRGAEIAALVEVLAGGRPGSALVVGEAGIGKSRLVRAAVDAVPGLDAATGNCLPLARTLPLLPIAEALRHLLAREPRPAWLADAPGWVRTELGRMVPTIGPANASLGRMDVEEGSHRYRMFEALRHVLAQAQGHGRVALVVEDLHWADEATLDALLSLLGSADACPVPVVLTVRDDMPPPVEAVLTRLELAGATRRVTLDELTEVETGQQMRETLGAVQSPAVVSEVYRRSGGNPLFVDQLLSHLSTAAEVPARRIPPGLEWLLRARVRAIDTQGLTVLRVLALADRPLDVPALAAVSELTPDHVADLVATLHQARLVTTVETDGGTGTAGRPGAVASRHALLTEVVRAMPIPGDERRRIHSALADLLVRGTGPDQAAPAAEIADHLAAAGRTQDQLPWRVRAGDRAQAVHAPQAAAHQFTLALETWRASGWVPLPDLDLEPWQLYERAFGAVDVSGDRQRAAELAEEAHRLLSDGADPRLLAWLEVNRGHFRRRLADPRAVTSLDTALSLAETHALSEMAMRVHQELAGLYLSQGDFRLAAEHVTAALGSVRAADRPDVVARLRAGDLWLSSALARVSAVEALAEAGRQGEAVDVSGAAAVEVRGRLGDLLLDLGDLGPAVELETRALEQADATGLTSGYWADAARYNLVEALLERGDTGRADEVVAQAYREGDPVTSPTGLVRAAVDLRLGRADLAARLWADAVPPSAHPSMRREFCLHHLDFAVWTEGVEPALEEALVVVESITPTDQSQFVGGLLALGMRAAVTLVLRAREPQQERRAEVLRTRLMAAREAARIDPFGVHVIPVTAGAHGLAWQAELSRLRSPEADDVAAERWQEIAGAWRALGRPHREAYALLREAEVRVTSGAPGRRPAEILGSAAAASAGHQPLAAAVGAVARMARLPVPHEVPARSSPAAMLSPRETAVLSLVVDGLTNVEIGRALHISPKTAGVHVSNILHKLGVRSRVQAAALATRLGLGGP